MLLKDKPLAVDIDKKLTIGAKQVYTNMISDDNPLASNRAEQPVSKSGSTGDFTNFDAVDYEIEKHIVTYNIEDWVDKIDESLKVKSTMDYVTV